MLNIKQIIPVDQKGMFSEIPCVIKVDGTVSRPLNTEVLPHFKLTKSSLMPVLNWIEKDWSLDLSASSHDRTVAFRILKNSIKNN